MFSCNRLLHYWRNDRDLLRAAAVTRGWNGYQNKMWHSVDWPKWWSMISVSRSSVHYVVLCELAPWSQSHSSTGPMYWRQERRGANDVFVDTLTVTMPKDLHFIAANILSSSKNVCHCTFSSESVSILRCCQASVCESTKPTALFLISAEVV